MVQELNDVILKEIVEIEETIRLLEEQSRFVLSENVIEMEGIVPKIAACNRNIAILEMKRKELIKGESLSRIVALSGNMELDSNYRKITALVSKAANVKDLNVDLLKQRLNFTNKLLLVLNPDRTSKIYNSYGKMKDSLR